MNKRIAELQRLYCLPGQLLHTDAESTTAAFLLPDPRGMTRAMVIGFQRATDWEYVATLYQTVQEELELPAPAVSIAGSAGYQLWFSLAEPVATERAARFVKALCRSCLHETLSDHLDCWPEKDETDETEDKENTETSPRAPKQLTLPPALHDTAGKWSAFIDPGLGSMFVDEPGLGMAPNMDRQADLLLRLESIKTSDFERVLNTLQGQLDAHARPDQAPSSASEQTPGHASPAQHHLMPGSHFSDPKRFLLAVMNDDALGVAQRIEAAKALLPYFHAIH